MTVSFLARDMQSMDLNGRAGRKKLGGVQARQSLNKIYFIKKNSVKKKIFNTEKENYTS